VLPTDGITTGHLLEEVRAVDRSRVEVAADVRELSEEVGHREAILAECLERDARHVRFPEQPRDEPEQHAFPVAARAEKHDGLAKRVAGEERVPDELLDQLNRVLRQHLG
jgi:hypothetical protein